MDDKAWLDNLEKELNLVESKPVNVNIVEMVVTLVSNLDQDKHQVIFQGRTKEGVFSELTYDVECELFVAVFGKLNYINDILTWNKHMNEGQ